MNTTMYMYTTHNACSKSVYVTIHAKRGLIRFFDGIEVFWFSKMP